MDVPILLNGKIATEIFHCSKSTYNRRLDEIEVQIRNGRYPKGSIIHGTHGRMVSCYVFADYLDKQKALNDRMVKKLVKPFNPVDYETCIPERVLKRYLKNESVDN